LQIGRIYILSARTYIGFTSGPYKTNVGLLLYWKGFTVQKQYVD